MKREKRKRKDCVKGGQPRCETIDKSTETLNESRAKNTAGEPVKH